jgi:putative transposase
MPRPGWRRQRPPRPARSSPPAAKTLARAILKDPSRRIWAEDRGTGKRRNLTEEEEHQAGTDLSAADEQLLRELTDRARAGGLKLTGEDGLLGRLTKMVVEGALEGELDDHLGYGKHDPAGRDCGNSRNGHRAKTVLTEAGPVEISVPRDRDSSFEPKIVAKRPRRLTGVEDMVIFLSAKGLTHGEIAAHLGEVYGAEVSKKTITAITDRVIDGLAEWQSRLSIPFTR